MPGIDKFRAPFPWRPSTAQLHMDPWGTGGAAAALWYYPHMHGTLRHRLLNMATEYRVRPAVSSFQLGQVPLLYCTLHKPALRQGAVMVAGLTALGACMPWYVFGVTSLLIVDHVLPPKGSRQAGH